MLVDFATQVAFNAVIGFDDFAQTRQISFTQFTNADVGLMPATESSSSTDVGDAAGAKPAIKRGANQCRKYVPLQLQFSLSSVSSLAKLESLLL